MTNLRLGGIGVCLLLAGPALAADTPRILVEPDHVEFRIGDKLVARLHTSSKQIKPYLWPINAPDGTTVTRGWPMAPPQPGGSIDHIHQKSGWLAYGDVIPAGADVSPRKKGVEGVDYWAEVPVHGRIVCIDRHKMDDGRAAVRNEWRTPAGAVILDETQAWGLHDLGAGWLLCVETALRARGDGVTFGDTKEGMFGVRVHDLLRSGTGKEAGSGRITNAHAKSGEKECWGRLADWCDVSGTIDGKAVGIALFDDPANKYRSCWHVRGYGLMAANPFGRQKSGFPDMKGKTDRVALAKGEQLILRYAVYTHGGDEKTGKVADAFAKFMELSRK